MGKLIRLCSTGRTWKHALNSTVKRSCLWHGGDAGHFHLSIPSPLHPASQTPSRRPKNAQSGRGKFSWHPSSTNPLVKNAGPGARHPQPPASNPSGSPTPWRCRKTAEIGEISLGMAEKRPKKLLAARTPRVLTSLAKTERRPRLRRSLGFMSTSRASPTGSKGNSRECRTRSLTPTASPAHSIQTPSRGPKLDAGNPPSHARNTAQKDPLRPHPPSTHFVRQNSNPVETELSTMQAAELDVPSMPS